MFVTHFCFCTQCMEGYNMKGTPILFSSQLLRPTGLRHKHPESARSGSTQMGQSACSTYKQAGQPFHTSCVTDLHRYKYISPPVVTTAMAAAKFVVSTYMHNQIFSSVLYVLSTQRGCVFGKHDSSYCIFKIHIFSP